MVQNWKFQVPEEARGALKLLLVFPTVLKVMFQVLVVLPFYKAAENEQCKFWLIV